jgi:gamma-glutamyl hercynylcysteine S-oxide synthase
MGAMRSSTTAPAGLTAARAIEALEEARRRTLGLVAYVSDRDLVRVHSPLMSPLVWDLAHIAAYEDLWLVHRFGERSLLREDLAATYDAFETPRAARADIRLLGPAEARDYLAEIRGRTLEVIDERGVGDGTLHEMVLRHEHQHNETMLQTLQLAQLKGYRLADPGPIPDQAGAIPGRDGAIPGRNGRIPDADGHLPDADGRIPDADGHLPDGNRPTRPTRPTQPKLPPHPTPTGLELVEVPAGPCTIGATETGFAYDNERPRHRTDVRRYLVGRTPITNATWLTFVEGGGYERREWWSSEGWAWKEQHDITRPGGWTADLRAEWRLDRLEPLQPARPVVHVSWFEADAFARAHGVRLPTEVEWEKAATWDEETDPARPRARRYPWGERRPVPGVHANLDQLGGGTAPATAHSGGASPYGCLGMIGDVWEWTSSGFDGYPGFVAHPYREYSEVFFGSDYKVLRGGSWATRTSVATPTFRNWDYPQRRQIFAGVRIAKDA